MKDTSDTLSNNKPNIYNIIVEPNEVIDLYSEKIKEKDEEIKNLKNKLFTLKIIFISIILLLIYIIVLIR